MLISLGILLIVTIINAQYDANLWKLGIRINHTKRAIIRFGIIAVLALIPFEFLTFGYFYTIVLLCSFFWLTFDMLIQAFKGNHLFKLGSTAFTDEFLRWITKTAKKESSKEYYAVFFKFTLFIILLFIYLLT